MPNEPASDRGWGAWEEDRRYPSKDATRLVVVLKRVDSTGKTYWKNERRPLRRDDG
jgi:hypothetical protein